MPKPKITMSLDEEVVTTIDERRGGEKRSTYVNSLLREALFEKKSKVKGKKGSRK